jgi:uncharacterized protein
MMMKLNVWDWIAFILVIIGALNWGLVGFFDWNLVTVIFGTMPMVGRVIYALVGLAGIYMIFAMPMYMRKEK